MSDGKLELPGALAQSSGTAFVTPLSQPGALMFRFIRRELRPWGEAVEEKWNGVRDFTNLRVERERPFCFLSLYLSLGSFQHSLWDLGLRLSASFHFQVNALSFVFVKISSEVLMACEHLFL